MIKKAWPSSMRTLSGDHERFETTYFKVYRGYYFTGDGCRRDKDGYYWLIGVLLPLAKGSVNECPGQRSQSMSPAQGAEHVIQVARSSHSLSTEMLLPQDGKTRSRGTLRVHRTRVALLLPALSAALLHRSRGAVTRRAGRVDDVINVSGHRIGTAEVEGALTQHPQCAEAAVVPMEHPIKGQGIYAYVTLMVVRPCPPVLSCPAVAERSRVPSMAFGRFQGSLMHTEYHDGKALNLSLSC